MHYLGMFSYQVAGVVHWNGGVVGLSLAASAACSTAALWIQRRSAGRRRELMSAGMMSLGILALHLLGMEAVMVTPLAVPDMAAGVASTGVALAIAILGLLIVGTGLSTSIIDMDERNGRTGR